MEIKKWTVIPKSKKKQNKALQRTKKKKTLHNLLLYIHMKTIFIITFTLNKQTLVSSSSVLNKAMYIHRLTFFQTK